MACYSGNENLVKYLVELEVDITIEDTRGETALFIACKNNNKNIVEYLVEHGADINKENQSAETPLFFA
jgi:ankyrin repeat protein